MDALAAQIDTVLSPQIANLQVVGRMNLTPTWPSIDIYPGDPFQERSGFGSEDVDLGLVVRARVSTIEHEGAQDVLLGLMDPTAATSVVKAVESDATLGGRVQQVICDPPSDFGAFVEPNSQGALLGCTWRARVIL